MVTTTDRDLMTLDDVKALLRVSRATVYRYMEQEDFPLPLRLGGLTNRWMRLEVERWLESRSRAAVRCGSVG